MFFLQLLQVTPPPVPPPAWPPIIIIGGIVLILVELGGIFYYVKKSYDTLKAGPADYCHVKFESGVMGTTVTCEGVCKSGGNCDLYSRRKGTENAWKKTDKDQPEDTTLEYHCYCHDPNRP